MVVNVTGYTLFAMSQYDIILVLVWRSLLTQHAYYSTHTLLTCYWCLWCVTVIHIN